MIVDAGQLSLVLALIATVYVAVGSLLGAWRTVPELARSARYALYTVPILQIGRAHV